MRITFEKYIEKRKLIVPEILTAKDTEQSESKSLNLKKIIDKHFAILIILFIYVILAVYFSATKSLWADEGFTVYIAGLPITEIFYFLRMEDAHPPLYYIVLHFVMLLGKSELILRLPSIFCAVGSILVIYCTAVRCHGIKKAVYSAVICAFSYFFMFWMLNVRMFGMAVFFALLSHYFYIRQSSGEPKRIFAAGYIFSSACAIYSNYLAVFALIAQGMDLLFKRKFTYLKNFLIYMLMVFLLFLPWLSSFFYQVSAGNGPPGRIQPALNDFFTSLMARTSLGPIGVFAGGDPSFSIVLLHIFAFIVFMAPLLYILFIKKEPLYPLTVILSFLFLYSMYFIVKRPMLQERYFLFSFPFWTYGAGIFFYEFVKKYKIVAASILSVYLLLNSYSYCCWALNPYYLIQDWKNAVENARLVPGDGIVVMDSYQYWVLIYYLGEDADKYYIRSFNHPEDMSAIIKKSETILPARVVVYASMGYQQEDPNGSILKALNEKMKMQRAVKYESRSMKGSIYVLEFKKSS